MCVQFYPLSLIYAKTFTVDGKYQGTWVPLDRGRDLAEQYGVGSYLSSVFDFVPSASVIAALPVIRTGTPDRSGQQTPSGLPGHPNQRVISPFANHGQTTPHMPPPQFIHQGNEQMMNLPPHPSSLAYPTQPKPYFSMPLQHTVGPQYDERHEGMTMTPTMSMDGLAPPADIARMGFPYKFMVASRPISAPSIKFVPFLAHKKSRTKVHSVI